MTIILRLTVTPLPSSWPFFVHCPLAKVPVRYFCKNWQHENWQPGLSAFAKKKKSDWHGYWTENPPFFASIIARSDCTQPPSGSLTKLRMYNREKERRVTQVFQRSATSGGTRRTPPSHPGAARRFSPFFPLSITLCNLIPTGNPAGLGLLGRQPHLGFYLHVYTGLLWDGGPDKWDKNKQINWFLRLGALSNYKKQAIARYSARWWDVRLGVQ